MKNKVYILFLYPFIQLNKKEGFYFIFNPLNNETLNITKINHIWLFDRLECLDWTCELSNEEYMSFKKIIETIIEKKMGGGYYQIDAIKKPGLIPPKSIIEIDAKKLKKTMPQRVSEKCLKYISNVTFILDPIGLDSVLGFEVEKKTNNNGKMFRDFIERALGELIAITKSVEFIADWNNKNSIEYLVNSVLKFNILPIVYVPLNQLYIFRNLDVNVRNSIHYVLILQSHSIDSLLETKLSDFKNIELKFYYVNETECVEIQKLISKDLYNSIDFLPLLSKESNIKKNDIKFSEKDLNSSIFYQSDFIINSFLNRNYFGKLYIYYTGHIYTSLFNSPIGNLKNSNLSDVVFYALTDDKSWIMTRKNIKPCKSCKYCDICPPISDYERYFGVANLCTHKEEKSLI